MDVQETIIFNGVTYRLMGQGRYYLSQSKDHRKRKNPKGLHVAIWEFYNGRKVPKGYCIHHKDGNCHNNDISNLECVPIRQHLSEHAKKNFERPEFREKNRLVLEQAQELAKKWHASPEGREWHTKHARAIDYTPRYKQVCEQCGKEFLSYQRIRKFCSDSCSEKHRTRRPTYTGICQQCGKEFHYGKAKPSRPDRLFCCRSCATTYKNLHRTRLQSHD